MEKSIRETERENEMVNEYTETAYIDKKYFIPKLNKMRNDYLKALDGAGASAVSKVIELMQKMPDDLIRCEKCCFCHKNYSPQGFVYPYCTRDGDYFAVELDDYCSWAEEVE